MIQHEVVYIPVENITDVVSKLGGHVTTNRSQYKVMFGKWEDRKKHPVFELKGYMIHTEGKHRFFCQDVQEATHIRFQTWSIANIHGYGKGRDGAIWEFARTLFMQFGCTMEDGDIVEVSGIRIPVYEAKLLEVVA